MITLFSGIEALRMTYITTTTTIGHEARSENVKRYEK